MRNQRTKRSRVRSTSSPAMWAHRPTTRQRQPPLTPNNFFGCCPTNRRQHDTSAGFSFGNEVPPIAVRSGGRLVLDLTLAMGFHTCWHSWWWRAHAGVEPLGVAQPLAAAYLLALSGEARAYGQGVPNFIKTVITFVMFKQIVYLTHNFNNDNVVFSQNISKLVQKWAITLTVDKKDKDHYGPQRRTKDVPYNTICDWA